MTNFWVFHYKKTKSKENEAFLHMKKQNLMKMTHFCIFDYDKGTIWKNCYIFAYSYIIKFLRKKRIFHISVLKRTKMTNVWVFQYFLYWNTQKFIIFLFCYFSYRNVHIPQVRRKWRIFEKNKIWQIMKHFWWIWSIFPYIYMRKKNLKQKTHFCIFLCERQNLKKNACFIFFRVSYLLRAMHKCRFLHV